MASWFTGWNLNLSSIIPTHADILINITDPHADKSKDKPSSAIPSHPASPSSNQTDVIILPTTPTAKKQLETVPIYTAGDVVSGDVTIALKPGTKIQHDGIRIECIGEIVYGDNRPPYIFYSQQRELQTPDILLLTKNFTYSFKNVDMEYETYNGTHVSLQYYIRITILRGVRAGGNIVRQKEFYVQNVSSIPEIDKLNSTGIKMEVGIEDCLHLEFDYNHSYYHLNDVVIGQIHFLLVRIKLKYMELVIIRREQCQASGANQVNATESSNIAKYEIMDGSPVKGESIPIRLFLSPYNLTPTHSNVHNKFSVKYYLNLVLVDDDDRRYFKQHEIVLWRKTINFKPQHQIQASQQQQQPVK